jgi:hypothetical protein
VTTVLLQREFEVADTFGVTGTPSGVIVRADGTIGSEVRPGPAPIRALVGETLGAGVLGPTALARNGHDHAGTITFTTTATSRTITRVTVQPITRRLSRRPTACRFGGLATSLRRFV